MTASTDSTSRPFAITASTRSNPRKLFTPVLVINTDGEDVRCGATVNAMWDTGAECCIMKRSLADLLGLDYSRPILSCGLTGRATGVYGYGVVSLANNGIVIQTEVAVIDDFDESPDYSFIIGLNLIKKGSLAITTLNGETTLTFSMPPAFNVDFARMLKDSGYYTATLPLSVKPEKIDRLTGLQVLKLMADSSPRI